MTIEAAAPDDLPQLDIRLAGGYYFGQLERLIKELEPLNMLDHPARVEIDLSGLAFIGPTALAFLLASSMRAVEAGCPVAITGPRNPLTNNYLLRMDFVRHFTDAEDFPEPFSRKEPFGFRPCAHFTNADQSVEVARDMAAALSERMSIGDASLNALRVCLHELSENVIYHADTALGGFAAVTASPKRREIEIGIVDLGIGIRASLIKNPDYAGVPDDEAAVKLAMRPTVSSTPERNSGYGLAWTQLMLLMNGGSLRIRSGYGAATLGLEAGGIKFETKQTIIPGTIVNLRARLDRPLDAVEVWRRLDAEIRKSNAQRTPASDHA